MLLIVFIRTVIFRPHKNLFIHKLMKWDIEFALIHEKCVLLPQTYIKFKMKQEPTKLCFSLFFSHKDLKLGCSSLKYFIIRPQLLYVPEIRIYRVNSCSILMYIISVNSFHDDHLSLTTLNELCVDVSLINVVRSLFFNISFNVFLWIVC